MANVKFSELPAASTISTADTIAVVQGGVTKKAAISLLPTGSGGGGGTASNVSIDVTTSPYSADKTGATDARAAINAAIAAAYALGGGEVLLPAGTYLVKVISPQPNGNAANKEIVLQPGVLLRGVPGATTIKLDADTAGQFGYLTRMVTNSGFRNIRIVRNSNFSTVLFGSEGGSDGFIVDGCYFDGAMDTYTGSGIFAHGFQLGNGATTNLRISNSTLRKLTYPLFQANAGTNLTETVRVYGNIFELNYATDLEFNGPHSTMQDIDISSNTFKNSNAPSSGGWFAVGFSNCKDVRVHHNRIFNYNGEGVHIEDGCSSVRVDHNWLQTCGKLSHLSYIQVIAYSRNVSIDHNYLDGDADTTPVGYMIGLQIGGSGTTEAGNPFIAPQYIEIDSNQIYAGRAGGIYSETALKVSITNNRISSRGQYSTSTTLWQYVASGGAVIAGVSAGHFGIKLYSGDGTVCSGNAIEGFNQGLATSDNGVETGGYGWSFTNNVINNSKYGLPVVDAARGIVTGNVITKSQHSIVAGQGAGSAKAVHLANNAAYDCGYPMEIGGKSVVIATAAASTGSPVSVPVEGLFVAIPNGTVITFSGGGSLTLTAAAVRGATTLTGNLTGANIASGAAGTATGIPYSTTSAENHLTGLLTNTDSAGAQWPA